MVSGAATAIDPSAFADLDVTFQATVLPDRESTKAFYRFVEERLGVKARRLALLYEDNTTYGQLSRTEGTPTEGTPTEGTGSDVLRIPFPIHISQIRTAYAQKAPPESPLSLASTKRPALSLEPDGPGGAVVTFSRLAPASVDAVLERLLSAIDGFGIGYVGILATDVRDKIFLARQLRENRPDVNLFTSGSDIIFGHPEAAPILRGMLVAAPYSLFPVERPWTTHPYLRGHRRQVQFASSGAQGVYNAALLLLDRRNRLLEYGAPFQTAGGLRQPVTWVSVVGYGGLWPVTAIGGDTTAASPAVYSDTVVPALHGSSCGRPDKPDKPDDLPFTIKDSAEEVCPPLPANFARRRADRARIVLYGAFAFGLLAVLSFGIAPSLASRPWDAIIPSAAQTSGPTIRRYGFVPRLLVFTAATVLLCQFVLLWTALPLWNGGRRFGLRWWLDVLLPSAVAWWWLWCSIKVSRCRRDMGKAAARWGLAGLITPLIVVSLCLGLMGTIAYWSWSIYGPAAPAERIGATDLAFLRLRASELGSGVNPVLPFCLLSLGGVAWALMTLHRYRLLEAFDCRHPYLRLTGSTFAGSRQLEKQLQRHLGGGLWLSPTPWVAFGAVSSFTVLLFLKYGITGLDGSRFLFVYACAFLASYLSLVLTCTRALVVWGNLRELLRLLATHPFAEAFRRVPRHLAWEPMLEVSGTQPRFADLEVGVRYGLRFCGSLGGQAGLLREEVGEAERKLHRAKSAFSARDWSGAIAARVDAQQALSRATRLLSLALAPWWRTGTLPEVARDGEVLLASRVLALVKHVFAQLRCLFVFLVVSLILMLCATASYPFQPKQLMLKANLVMLLFVVGSLLKILIEIDRDTLLSIVAHGEAHRVTWNREFLGRLTVYVALPIAGFVATQLPELAGMLRPLTAFLGR